MKINEKQKRKVEERGYIYIGTYESYIVTKENDEIKNKYAKENNWKLIRINQCDFKNIDEIINNLLNI